MSNLRLDTKEGAFAERKGYRILTPGDASKSRLFERINHEKKAIRMPPASTGPGLTAAQIDLIRRWINEGANWQQHWAYVAPSRPEPPAVANKAWAKNPIDRFILARLQREGLKPAGPAGKSTLLRRVTLDLTGLPPTPAEIATFLADKSPLAYEKVVDRLLASPRYGERMAMQWLDLARYADTHGFHIDSHRDMWPWRDWVISAFNRNLPFDQFTIWQLAGDLLPNATTEQKIATGFNRNHMINFEGGAIPEEYQTEYMVDRVDTTSNVWMGTTMGCARCHDHKYDPIKQRDFYSFGAFFNTIPEKGLDGRAGNAEPVLALPTTQQKARQDELNYRLAVLEDQLPESEIAPKQLLWEKTALASMPADPRAGILAHYDFEGSLSDLSGHYQHGKSLRGEIAFTGGPVGRAADFGPESHVRIASLPAGPFSLALWLRPTGSQECSVLHNDGFEIALDETVYVPELKRGAFLYVRFIDRGSGKRLEWKTRERLIRRDWYHVAINWDGAGTQGLKLYLNGTLHDAELLRADLVAPPNVATPLEIGDKANGKILRGTLDDLRIFSRPLTAEEITVLATHLPAQSILETPAAKRSKEQKIALRDYFLSHAAPEPLRKNYREWAALRRQLVELDRNITTVMVMQEMPRPRETFVLGRGDYRNKGDKVTPSVPAVLPPLPKAAPANRLTLARWLVDPSHPLTARVAVNRYWQMYFGHGIVKTTEDFGAQGEAPVHPELLDWLATEFVRSGWDVKAMQKLIVTSAAYRQSSVVTPQMLEKDPENRLLARGPRFRIPAEMIRDTALAVSGLLNPAIGGRSVFPYSPAGLWDEISFGDVYSAQTYTPSHGADLYRRSMYTFWKRTAPPSAMITFDAPDREKCASRRAVTNTPLQALALLNEPAFVEAARTLAQRMLHEGGQTPAQRIAYAYLLTLARKPAPAEARVLQDLASRKLTDYRTNQEAAAKLLAVGESKFDEKLDRAELAAWTTVASVILNLDETITKE